MAEAQDSRQSGDELYSVTDAQAQQDYVGGRSAEKWVGFFLPHLRSGMSVLDCGCGVGSITLDLAQRVAPGQVIGIDVDETQLKAARLAAERRGLQNVRFETGDIYHLNFPTASFDAVLAHTLLIHLTDRAAALLEMERVLKPGGVIGVSDDDYRTKTAWPTDAPILKFFELFANIIKFNGGDPYYSVHLRGLLREAGFVRTEGHAVAAEYYGTLEETRRFARILDRVLSEPALVELAVRQGFIEQGGLESLRKNILDWADNPDAFFGILYCAALGWKAG